MVEVETMDCKYSLDRSFRWLLVTLLGWGLAQATVAPREVFAQAASPEEIASETNLSWGDTGESGKSAESVQGPKLIGSSAVIRQSPPAETREQDSASSGPPLTVASAPRPSRKPTPAGPASEAPPELVSSPDTSAPLTNSPEATTVPSPTPDTSPDDSSEEEEKETEKNLPEPTPDTGSLQPTPDDGKPTIHTAQFHGATPGETTLEELKELWGSPRQVSQVDDQRIYLYSMEECDHVEVMFTNGVLQSLIIRMEQPFPANQVRQALDKDLHGVRPVFVSDQMGEIVGQCFPEKGVLFAFEPSGTPGHPSRKVSEIIIEPVTAEPFVLRGETYLSHSLKHSRQDLENAIDLDPGHARANWLLARVSLLQGNLESGLAECREAIRLNPDLPQFYVTEARILAQLDRYEEAKHKLEEMLPRSDRYPHVRARALCLMGDLWRNGISPDFEKAIEYHSEAIKAANTIANHSHPAIRLAAKEVLLDAHLAAARDVAWGNWDDKEKAVEIWLDRAADVAEDIVKNEKGSQEYLFRVSSSALAAFVGIGGTAQLDVYIEEVIRLGKALIDNTEDPLQQCKYQWDIGLALYDAVQIYQARKKFSEALQYGQAAVEYLEKGHHGRTSHSDTYLLARLYFRLGAIHAVGMKNHRAAIVWFDRARPIFDRLALLIPEEEVGRLGETLVSMGVSYWETSQKELAVELSEQGVSLIEVAVKNGLMDTTALAVPYTNLSTMYRRQEKHAQADRYFEMSLRVQESNDEKDTKLR